MIGKDLQMLLSRSFTVCPLPTVSWLVNCCLRSDCCFCIITQPSNAPSLRPTLQNEKKWWSRPFAHYAHLNIPVPFWGTCLSAAATFGSDWSRTNIWSSLVEYSKLHCIFRNYWWEAISAVRVSYIYKKLRCTVWKDFNVVIGESLDLSCSLLPCHAELRQWL